jgi:hypothetical protein
MTVPSIPKPPVPTGLAWLLLESLQQGSLLKNIAEIASTGADVLETEQSQAQGAFYKLLTKLRRGHQPRANKLTVFQTALHKGALRELHKSRAYSKEQINAIIKRLDAATGPYAALSARFVPEAPNIAQQHLLDFSTNLDELGLAFAAAEEKDDLETAKNLLLRSNWLDEAYWSFPEPGMEDPHLNRETFRTAANWEQLKRASVPLVLNTSIAWLGWLDLAVVTGGRDEKLTCPLFLSLTTRFTPEAAALLRQAQPLPVYKWSESFELPVPNLIATLKSIVAEVNQNMQKRAKPPKRRPAAKGERESLSSTLKDVGRYDVLSMTQFERLLGAFATDDTPEPGERCGFDVYALHLATNLFSLLTPREDKIPTNEIRRERPQSITICEDIPTVYERWWQRNKREMAEDAV